MRARQLLLIVTVGLAIAAPPAAGKDRPAQKVTPVPLDALAREYRDAGLPLPPPDAPLVCAQIRSGASIGRSVAEYVIGFKLDPEKADDSPNPFLMGTQKGWAENGNPGAPPALRPLDAARGLPPKVNLVRSREVAAEPFAVNNWLALAIQCHLRGYDRLAGQIFARGLARGDATGSDQSDADDWRDALAVTAWNHWMNVLCREGTDRREILAQLEKLAADFPTLDDPSRRDDLASLRLAAVPGKSAPGSVEGLVDALVDHTGIDDDANNPGYVRLQALGFEAVPVLLAHLDDRRLTRAVTDFGENAPTRPRYVGEVVDDLIRDIAGQSVDKEAVARWWTQARAQGEETYMVREVFPPTEVSLRIVVDRYPQRLGEIYARMLKERPGENCQPILAAISNCAPLGREEQRRLIHLGIDSPDLGCFSEALGALSVCDRADADKALAEKLAHWPTDDVVPYGSMSPVMSVSYLVWTQIRPRSGRRTNGRCSVPPLRCG